MHNISFFINKVLRKFAAIDNIDNTAVDSHIRATEFPDKFEFSGYMVLGVEAEYCVGDKSCDVDIVDVADAVGIVFLLPP